VTRQTFGQKLRRERERRKITLIQLATRTKVSASLYRSLESGSCARWPGGIYGRGFVRAYAEAVGLDPDDTVALFGECYPEFAATHTEPPAADPSQDDTGVTLEKVKAAISALFGVTVNTTR
jgi:cytoskeletal protein RodZ